MPPQPSTAPIQGRDSIFPPRRERGGQHRARRGHCGGTGTIGGDEQVKFPALPRDHHPPSGHPLPDMPPHHRLPAREGQRCPDRALPPGPPRNTRPPLLPVARRTDRARPDRPLPSEGKPARQDHATDPTVTGHGHPHCEGTHDIRLAAARRLAAATNWGVRIRPIRCTRSPAGRAGKHPDLPMSADSLKCTKGLFSRAVAILCKVMRRWCEDPQHARISSCVSGPASLKATSSCTLGSLNRSRRSGGITSSSSKGPLISSIDSGLIRRNSASAGHRVSITVQRASGPISTGMPSSVRTARKIL